MYRCSSSRDVILVPYPLFLAYASLFFTETIVMYTGTKQKQKETRATVLYEKTCTVYGIRNHWWYDSRRSYTES